MRDYLIELHKKTQERKEYMLYNVPVYILNKLPSSLNIINILDIVKDELSVKLIENIDAIYVGKFKELDDRALDAMFQDGAIWISSDVDERFITEEIIANNIVHEVAHSLEDRYNHFIYEDGNIEKEYHSKKYKLMEILKAEGYEVFFDLFFKLEYLSEFDRFLYKEVGYDKLALLSLGLFITPYSVTTIREYFGNGFQMYLSAEQNYLKDISPTLYNKIKDLIDEIGENRNEI